MPRIIYEYKWLIWRLIPSEMWSHAVWTPLSSLQVSQLPPQTDISQIVSSPRFTLNQCPLYGFRCCLMGVHYLDQWRLSLLVFMFYVPNISVDQVMQPYVGGLVNEVEDMFESRYRSLIWGISSSSSSFSLSLQPLVCRGLLDFTPQISIPCFLPPCIHIQGLKIF